MRIKILAFLILLVLIGNYLVVDFQENKVKKEINKVKEISVLYDDINCHTIIANECSISNIKVAYHNIDAIIIDNLEINKLHPEKIKITNLNTAKEVPIYKNIFPLNIVMNSKNDMSISNIFFSLNNSFENEKDTIFSNALEIKNINLIKQLFLIYKDQTSHLNENQLIQFHDMFLNSRSNKVLNLQEFEKTLIDVLNLFLENSKLDKKEKQYIDLTEKLLKLLKNKNSILKIEIEFKENTRIGDILMKQDLSIIKSIKSQWRQK